jgi:LuxR family maltose regulon positive regulatory protein
VLAYRRQLTERAFITKQIVLDLTLARLYFQQNRQQQALESLAQAISAAFQDGYIQPFVEEADWLAPLLPELRSLAPPFVDRILAYCPEPDSVIFTNRENELIPLLLQGYTNVQIADEMHVSVNTVKYHLKNIYKKLGVENRTQAVQHLNNL